MNHNSNFFLPIVIGFSRLRSLFPPFLTIFLHLVHSLFTKVLLKFVICLCEIFLWNSHPREKLNFHQLRFATVPPVHKSSRIYVYIYTWCCRNETKIRCHIFLFGCLQIEEVENCVIYFLLYTTSEMFNVFNWYHFGPSFL